MKIVLYGAGRRGRNVYEFLKEQGYENDIYGFCDKNAENICEIAGKKVWLPENLQEKDIKYCITIADSKEKEKIKQIIGEERCIEVSDLADLFQVDKVKFNRDFCAFYHIEGMDGYFEQAEKQIYVFWNTNSEFYQMFQKLDISRVIELACGHGRHVEYYFNRAEEITLVDILQKNIDICKQRFGNHEKVKFYKNNGYDLKELNSNYYTALFSYDAIVHFELIDIYSYLKDIYRVLAKGGRALIHHSNYHMDYKADFCNAPASRNFMSKECFAYLAHRAGFTILEQKVIDWGGYSRVGLHHTDRKIRWER